VDVRVHRHDILVVVMDKLSDSVTDVDEPHELFAVQYRRRSNVLVDEDLGEIPHAVRRRDGDELIFRRHDFGGGYVCHVATCGRECLQDNVLFLIWNEDVPFTLKI